MLFLFVRRTDGGGLLLLDWGLGGVDVSVASCFLGVILTINGDDEGHSFFHSRGDAPPTRAFLFMCCPYEKKDLFL